ncbi:MAG: hypothetical protein ABH835_01230 [Patescibacteria group bacterium]
MKSSSLIHPYIVLFLVVPFLFISCEKDKYTALDISVTPPYLFDGKLDKYLIDTDTISANGQFSITDTINISIRIYVHATDPNGQSDIMFLKYQIVSQYMKSVIVSGTLNDMGLEGDSLSNDGIYTASVSFSIPRVVVGLFKIKMQAKDRNELLSNEIILGLNITRKANYPIISGLNAPYSITLPSSGSKVINMSIAAADSDGLADIKEVFFRSLDSSDPTKKYFLFDNGNIASNGDSLADDGIYSIKVELPYNMTAKPYRFEFQAKDFTELLSNKILHTLNVVRP